MSRRLNKRALFRGDGSPVAALEAALHVFGAPDLAALEAQVMGGKLTPAMVVSCRGCGSLNRPGALVRYLFSKGELKSARRGVATRSTPPSEPTPPISPATTLPEDSELSRLTGQSLPVSPS